MIEPNPTPQVAESSVTPIWHIVDLPKTDFLNRLKRKNDEFKMTISSKNLPSAQETSSFYHYIFVAL